MSDKWQIVVKQGMHWSLRNGEPVGWEDVLSILNGYAALESKLQAAQERERQYKNSLRLARKKANQLIQGYPEARMIASDIYDEANKALQQHDEGGG